MQLSRRKAARVTARARAAIKAAKALNRAELAMQGFIDACLACDDFVPLDDNRRKLLSSMEEYSGFLFDCFTPVKGNHG